MVHRLLNILFSAALVQFFQAIPLQAQDQWSWPEKPENIQVLSKDWPGSRLRPVMIGFTRALGVRCSHCHVGEVGKPLSTYDFPSDANPNKDRAREMLRMLGSINDHLKNIEPSGDKRVNMWCHTCHSGRPRPMTLEEIVGETYKLMGIEAALEHYADLKENYYGKGAYNFGERALNALGYKMLGNEDVSGAIAFFELNAKEFPRSANGWDSLAEGCMRAGKMKLAKKYYKKSLKLNPNNPNAKDMLKRLREEQRG